MAQSLGKNIPPNQPLNNIASIASAVPLSCFNNTNPGTLCNLISSMDTENMSPFKKAFIGAKVFKKKNFNYKLNLNYLMRKIIDSCF